jgi:hypothetical protein
MRFATSKDLLRRQGLGAPHDVARLDHRSDAGGRPSAGRAARGHG